MRAQHKGTLDHFRRNNALEVLQRIRAHTSLHLSQPSPANAQEDRPSWLEARSWLTAGLSRVPVNADARHRCCLPLLASAERNARSSSREGLSPGLLQLLQLWVEQQPAEVWHLLVWSGQHPRAPVTVATSTHYFCELDVVAERAAAAGQLPRLLAQPAAATEPP
ncbi:MAG: hypothetical protein WDW36_004740 [Sanguina aurantia]